MRKFRQMSAASLIGISVFCYVQLCHAAVDPQPVVTPINSDYVESEKFKITFPGNPHKLSFTVNVNGRKVIKETYQYESPEGLYAFSPGVITPALNSEEEKKNYVNGLFDAMIAATPGVEMQERQVIETPRIELRYSYTSEMHNADWVHVGKIVIIDPVTYLKVTLVSPFSEYEDAKQIFVEFLNSLVIKGTAVS